MDITETIPIQRISGQDKQEMDDLVIREFPLTIVLNNQELVTLLCSPTDLKYLAVGYLASEGLVKNKEEIVKVLLDERKGIARIETKEEKNLANDLVFKRTITTGCGRGASFYSAADLQENIKIESRMEISASEIYTLVKEFQHRSDIFKNTGGVHSAALCGRNSIHIFQDDIGRHNAIDKIVGQCLLEDMQTDDKIIITSGRISSEILLKVVKRYIPILISRSAPTNLGVKLANDFGMTLIGFVRGQRMNVYTHSNRIT